MREKAEIRKLRVGGLLAPWLAEALDKMKMISVRDLRITNFSLFGQKHFPPKYVKLGVFCLLNLMVKNLISNDFVISLPLKTFRGNGLAFFPLGLCISF